MSSAEMLPRVLSVKVDKQSSAKCLFICWKVATFTEVDTEIPSYKSVNAEDYKIITPVFTHIVIIFPGISVVAVGK